jgi:hypothetical protein
MEIPSHFHEDESALTGKRVVRTSFHLETMPLASRSEWRVNEKWPAGKREWGYASACIAGIWWVGTPEKVIASA